MQQQCTMLIQERTGHRSLDALRTYERSNDQQQKEAVSSILSPTKILSPTTAKTPSNSKKNTSKPNFSSVYAYKFWEPARMYNKYFKLFSATQLQLNCNAETEVDKLYSPVYCSYSYLTS